MKAARLFFRRACHAGPITPFRPSRRFISLSSVEVRVPPEHKDKTLAELVEVGVLSQKAARWLSDKTKDEVLGHVAPRVNPTYNPQQLISNPPSLHDVTLELLLASQCHLGHSTTLWHSANARYIFGIRDGIHIISLEQTAAHLRRAAKVVRQVAERAGVILFANTRKGHEQSVVKAASLTGGYHLIDKWIPGALTNGERILGHCSLKVVDQEDREIEGFEEQLDDITTAKPDLVVCLNPTDNYVFLHECALYNIPTIGIVDTNANPTWVTYPIPANDDSPRSTALIAGVLGRAGEEGRLRRIEAAKGGEITWEPTDKLVMPEEYGKADPQEGKDLDEEEVLDLGGTKTKGQIKYAEKK